MTAQDTIKVALTFLNGFAGVIAAYPGPEVGPLARLVCAALVIACGATLLLVQPPGKEKPLTARQTRQVADEIERRLRADADETTGDRLPAVPKLRINDEMAPHG